MDLKEIQNLIRFVAKSGASEVKLEMEDVKITIKTGTGKTETTIDPLVVCTVYIDTVLHMTSNLKSGNDSSNGAKMKESTRTDDQNKQTSHIIKN